MPISLSRLFSSAEKITRAKEIRDNLASSSGKEIASSAVETGFSIMFKRFLPMLIIGGICISLVSGIIGYTIGFLLR